MKKIIINANDSFALYTFRLNLIKELMKDYEVHLLASYDSYTPLLEKEGLKVEIVDLVSSKVNFIKDLKSYKKYKKIFKRIKPDLIINYTLKPHILATLARPRKTRVINVVTGVGSVFLNHDLKFKIASRLYRVISRRVDHYIFLNKDDYQEFNSLKFIKKSHSFLHSEGVDLDKFYPIVDFSLPPTFLFVGRLVKEKGIIEYLEAAKMVKRRYPNAIFLVAGSFYNKSSSINKDKFNEYVQSGVINYLGYVYNIEEVLREVHVVVLPSYREGMPLSLIEALASKKVIVASNVIGSSDIVMDGINGFLCTPKSSYDLTVKMENYINYPDKETLHNRAYSTSKRYDQKKIIEEMKKIIRGLI